MRSLGLLCVALVACSGGEAEPPAGSAPTYHRDVRPIVEDVCLRCHDEGGIAPYALDSYAKVHELQELVRIAVVNRTMPPWLAGPDCEEYRDDLALTDAQIAVIEAWVEAGAPEGDPADAPPPPEPLPAALARVDVSLQLPVAYTPAADVEDDYRCFVLDWPEEEPLVYATGMTVTPGNEAIVHHVIAYIVPPDLAESYDALEGADGRPGYECFGSPAGDLEDFEEDGLRWLGGWAPGGAGGTFPEGTGISIEAGSRVIIQVHYHPPQDGSDPGTDQTSLDLMLDSTVDKPAFILPYADITWVEGGTMDIPANTEGVTHSVSYPMPSSFLIHTANLHMHKLGRSARLQLDRVDGEEDCMLDIPRWDFDWQRPYRFTEPKLVEVGDQITLSCTWDNPTDADVNWGDGTNDEMCLGTMYVTDP